MSLIILSDLRAFYCKCHQLFHFMDAEFDIGCQEIFSWFRYYTVGELYSVGFHSVF